MPFPSAAIFARGTLIQVGDGGDPEDFDTVAEVRDIEDVYGNQVRQFEDVTTQETPQESDEVKPGMMQNGELPFEVNYLATHPTHDHITGLRSDFNLGTLRSFRNILPPGAGNLRISYSAYVARYSVTASVNGILRGRIVLRPTGPMTTEPNT